MLVNKEKQILELFQHQIFYNLVVDLLGDARVLNFMISQLVHILFLFHNDVFDLILLPAKANGSQGVFRFDIARYTFAHMTVNVAHPTNPNSVYIFLQG